MQRRYGRLRVLDRLQREKNKFLRIILNVSLDTRIDEIYNLAEIESIDEVVLRMICQRMIMTTKTRLSVTRTITKFMTYRSKFVAVI